MNPLLTGYLPLDAKQVLVDALLGSDLYMAIAPTVIHYGPSRMPEFIDQWLEAAFGDAGQQNHGLTVSVVFVDTRTGLQEPGPDDVNRYAVWAGRFAAAWLAGDTPMMDALNAVPATASEHVMRAMQIIRGIVEMATEAAQSEN